MFFWISSWCKGTKDGIFSFFYQKTPDLSKTFPFPARCIDLYLFING